MNFLAERTYFEKSILIKQPFDDLIDIHHLDLWHPFYKNPTWYSVNESVYDLIIPEHNKYIKQNVKCRLDKKTSTCYCINISNIDISNTNFIKDEMWFTIHDNELKVSFIALPCPVRNDLKLQIYNMLFVEFRWKKKEYRAKKIFRYIVDHYG